MHVFNNIYLFNLSSVFLQVDKMYFFQSVDCIFPIFWNIFVEIVRYEWSLIIPSNPELNNFDREDRSLSAD